MATIIDPEDVIEKLAQKTEAGRIEWSGGMNSFSCELENRYRFEISRDDDIYTVVMMDDRHNEIFRERAREELIYADDETRRKSETVRRLYDLARRDALDVEAKIAGVSELLDKI